MKLANSTILAIAVAGGFSLTAYVMAQQGASLPTNAGQNIQAGQGPQGQAQQGAPRADTTVGPTGAKGSSAAQPDTTIGPTDAAKSSTTNGSTSTGMKSMSQTKRGQKAKSTTRTRSAAAAATATASPKITAPP